MVSAKSISQFSVSDLNQNSGFGHTLVTIHTDMEKVPFEFGKQNVDVKFKSAVTCGPEKLSLISITCRIHQHKAHQKEGLSLIKNHEIMGKE